MYSHVSASWLGLGSGLGLGLGLGLALTLTLTLPLTLTLTLALTSMEQRLAGLKTSMRESRSRHASEALGKISLHDLPWQG